MDKVEEICKRVKDLPDNLQDELLKIIRSWQAGKQREYQRQDTVMDIDVLIGDTVLQTNMKNISASGVFIKTAKPIDVKKDVKVVFSLAGSEKPFKLEGVVVRSDKNGMAVQFTKVSPYFKCILDDAIWGKQDHSFVEYLK